MNAEAIGLRNPWLETRKLLWIGGLATGLVLSRAALRGIHVPGHAALPALFAFVFAADRLRVPGAALAVALPASAVGAIGWGAGGGVAWLLGALLVDAAALASPRLLSRAFGCAAIGSLAGSLRFLPDLPVWFGLLPDAGAPALLSLIGHSTFGALGAACVPLLSRSRNEAPARAH